jgi:hypothetical protein
MNRFCGWVGIVHSYPMNKFMGCSDTPYHQEAAHGFNRGIKDSTHLSPALTVLTVSYNKPMNRFCSWAGVVHSYPMNKFMGCSLANDGEQVTHGFNRGTGQLLLPPLLQPF